MQEDKGEAKRRQNVSNTVRSRKKILQVVESICAEIYLNHLFQAQAVRYSDPLHPLYPLSPLPERVANIPKLFTLSDDSNDSSFIFFSGAFENAQTTVLRDFAINAILFLWLIENR